MLRVVSSKPQSIEGSVIVVEFERGFPVNVGSISVPSDLLKDRLGSVVMKSSRYNIQSKLAEQIVYLRVLVVIFKSGLLHLLKSIAGKKLHLCLSHLLASFGLPFFARSMRSGSLL